MYINTVSSCHPNLSEVSYLLKYKVCLIETNICAKPDFFPENDGHNMKEQIE